MMGMGIHRGVKKSSIALFHSIKTLVKHHLDTIPTLCKVTLCGHSLGAAIAAATALLLRRYNPGGDAVTITAVGFGGPPFASMKLANEMKEFVTYVVNRNDVVS